MKRIQEFIGRELKWIQPRATSREFELKADDEVAAVLRFRTLFGSLATAETADGSWSFKRVGFWQTHVTIRPAGVDEETAIFVNNTWTDGGTLTLADRRQLRANTNMWNSKYEFKTESGESLVRYRKIGGLLHLSSLMEIAPSAAGYVELPWLVALGWYLAVKMHDDASAASAAAF